jgi:hypothetical protein
MSLGQVICPCCNGPMPINEGKNGSLSGKCGKGAQLLLKSVSAVNSMRARLVPAPAPAAPPKPASALAPKPATAPKRQGFFDRL